MKAKLTLLLALLLLSMPLFAGGGLETYDITAGAPSPIAGHWVAEVIPIRWDDRSIPVPYLVNNTLDPVPNALGAGFLTLADATTALQGSFDAWNVLPASYIQMQIVGTTSNPGLRGFDFKNELTFRTASGFTAIASSPSVSLIADSVFEHGDDIDGDGDSDVSSSITVMTDVDGDGDNEFPAGFYKAGTILDNDVQFNTKVSNGFRFTVGNAAVDTVTRSVDLHCVAVHEFGHSFGLAHSLDNQESATEGDGATMFPFIDTGDPAAELAQGSINIDDIAWASYFYQEGTAASGPAALQAGDVPFASQFGLITGEIRHGVLDQPIAGASVFTRVQGSAQAGPSGYSGTTRLSFNPANGGLFFMPTAAQGIVDGKYVVPVPKGSWNVGVEPLDGNPAAGSNISFTGQIGGFYGLMTFNEEFYNRSKEGKVELRPGQPKNVPVKAGQLVSGIDITTTKATNVNNFGTRDFIGFTGSPAGRYYAVRVPAAQIAAIRPGQEIWVHGAAFDTIVVDASVPVLFSEALLTKGTVDAGTVSIDLVTPFYRQAPFLAQDNDFAPLYLPEPQDVGRQIRTLTDSGAADVFMVLRLPTTAPFPGVSAQPPLIGLDGGVATNDVPIFGLSYISSDGLTWTPTTFNFRFSLVISEPVN